MFTRGRKRFKAMQNLLQKLFGHHFTLPKIRQN